MSFKVIEYTWVFIILNLGKWLLV